MVTTPDFRVTRTAGKILALEGQLDMETAPKLAKTLAEPIRQGAPVVLDMSAVSFMDSTGIKEIFKALRSMPGGRMILHGVTGEVARVLEIGRIDDAPRVHVIPCNDLDATSAAV